MKASAKAIYFHESFRGSFRGSNLRGSFHGSFRGSFRGSFHGSLRGSFFRGSFHDKIPWKLLPRKLPHASMPWMFPWKLPRFHASMEASTKNADSAGGPASLSDVVSCCSDLPPTERHHPIRVYPFCCLLRRRYIQPVAAKAATAHLSGIIRMCFT